MRKTWRRVYLGVADFSPLFFLRDVVLDRVKQKYFFLNIFYWVFDAVHYNIDNWVWMY